MAKKTTVNQLVAGSIPAAGAKKPEDNREQPQAAEVLRFPSSSDVRNLKSRVARLGLSPRVRRDARRPA
jgi:hypothetical protein